MWEPLIHGSNPCFPTILMERWLSGLKQRLAKASTVIGPQVRILQIIYIGKAKSLKKRRI